MDHHCKSQDRQRWTRFAPVAVMLAVGLALSVTAFIVVRHLENARLEDAFQQRVGAIAASLKRSVDISLGDVYSLANFLTVSNDVDAAKFRSFVTPMLERHPALLSLTWVQRVTGSARSAYEVDVRAARRPGLEIFELDGQRHAVRAGSRPEYFVIHYRESIVESDGRKVLGFAQAVFSIGHLVDMSLAGTHPPGINVLFFDWGADPSERGLYRYGSNLQRGTRELAEDESTIRAGLHFSTVVPVGGREWELLGHPTTAYLSAERSAWSLGVLRSADK